MFPNEPCKSIKTRFRTSSSPETELVRLLGTFIVDSNNGTCGSLSISGLIRLIDQLHLIESGLSEDF